MGDTPFNVFLSEKDAAAYLGISLPKMRRLRRDGVGPQFIHFGDITRYTAAALNSFLAEHTVRPAKDAQASNGGAHGA